MHLKKKKKIVRKNPSSFDFTGIRTHVPTSEGFELPAECVCVVLPIILDVRLLVDVPAGVTQEECHTGFLIHLPSAVLALFSFARRIQPFLSLVSREVEFLCTDELIVLHLMVILFYFIYFYIFFL